MISYLICVFIYLLISNLLLTKVIGSALQKVVYI